MENSLTEDTQDPTEFVTSDTKDLPSYIDQAPENTQNPNEFITSDTQDLTSLINHVPAIHMLPPDTYKEQPATSERVPTTTWGPFTIIVVVVLVLLTCCILNCNRIRRKVDETKMHRLGKTGSFSFENRHKQLQEADLEWNSHPPIVYTQDNISAPESTHSNKSWESNSSIYSKHSAYSGWSSNNSTLAQTYHYYDPEFLKHQPPSVQLRLTLESASKNSRSELSRNYKSQPSSHSGELGQSRQEQSPIPHSEACFSKEQ